MRQYKRFCYNMDGTCENERCNCSRVCMYDVSVEASGTCVTCGGGLCDICGYRANGERLCNSCYHEKLEKSHEPKVLDKV